MESYTELAGADAPDRKGSLGAFQRQKDGSWKIVNGHVSMPPERVP